MLSIELVPKETEKLLWEAKEVAGRYPQFTWLNIPDIRALGVRSHDAALAAASLPLRVIPHLRARDREVGESLAIMRRLAEAGVRDVLVVTGDRYSGEERADHPTTLDVLRAAKAEAVPITLWAAFDPYRGELRAELDYARAKLEAGAAGLFTQPFFDERLAEICLEQLEGVPTFVGVSPVTTEKSRAYWERTNRVVFPAHFQPTLEHCARLTVELLKIAERHNQHAYLMPIKVDPLVYLREVFARVESP